MVRSKYGVRVILENVIRLRIFRLKRYEIFDFSLYCLFYSILLSLIIIKYFPLIFQPHIQTKIYKKMVLTNKTLKRPIGKPQTPLSILSFITKTKVVPDAFFFQINDFMNLEKYGTSFVFAKKKS